MAAGGRRTLETGGGPAPSDQGESLRSRESSDRGASSWARTAHHLFDELRGKSGKNTGMWEGPSLLVSNKLNQCQLHRESPELVVGGWFASAVIRNLVSVTRSYLSNNASLNKESSDMLDELQVSLPHIQEMIDVAEQISINHVKPMSQRSIAGIWLRELKDAAHDAEDVLDDFEAKVIRMKIQGKSSHVVSSALSPLSNVFPRGDVKRLKDAIRTIKRLCDKGDSLVVPRDLNFAQRKSEKISIRVNRESSPFTFDAEVIGRDEEISLIMDMVLAAYSSEAPISTNKETDNDKPESSQRGWIIHALRRLFPTWTGESSEQAAPDVEKSKDKDQEIEETQPSKRGAEIEEIQPSWKESERGGLDPSKKAMMIREGAAYGKGKDVAAEVSLLTSKGSSFGDHKVSVLPIIGIAGIGKTTVAQVVFNKERVKEYFDIRGWIYVSEIVDRKKVVTQIIRSFEGRRFLIVLDDVWDDITTVWDDLYRVFQAGASGSVVLTFLFRHLKRIDLESIGRRIAEKLHGLPLAAKIVGRLLSMNLDKGHWEEVLQSPWWNIANNRMGEEILASIGIGYYNLSPHQRQCFLYCSIFPRNYVFEVDKLVRMWISHGFVQINSDGNNRMEIKEGRKWFYDLVDRSYLVPTVWENRYMMHDLLRDFAVTISSYDCFILSEYTMHVPNFVRHLSIDRDNFDVQWGDYDREKLRTLLTFGHCRACKTQEKLYRHTLKSSTGLRVLDLSYVSLGMTGNDFLTGIGGLLHLRYLDLSFTGISELPESFCYLCHLQLTKLQELHEFRIKAKIGHRISELRDLRDLGGSLCISNLLMVADREESLNANLSGKHYLTSLDLRFESCEHDITPASHLAMEILDGLRPSRTLEELKISNYPLSTFPDWMGQLRWLATLPPLGQLEHLQKLVLNYVPSITHVSSEVYGTSEAIFRSLEALSFKLMDGWVDWEEAGDAVVIAPKLQKLKISSCLSLRRIPFRTLGADVTELRLSGSGLCADEISSYLQRLTALTHLYLEGTYKTITLPCRNLRSLVSLQIRSCKEVLFKGGPLYLKNLKNLSVRKVQKITAPLDEEPSCDHPTQSNPVLNSLTHLDIDGLSLSQLLNLDNMRYKIPVLQTLKLSHLPKLTASLEMFLEQFTMLQQLEFHLCGELTRLPSNLASILSLKKLSLSHCPQIHSLPLNGLPGSLKELQIEGCSQMLEARCLKEPGEDWPKKEKMDEWRQSKQKEWWLGKRKEMLKCLKKNVEDMTLNNEEEELIRRKEEEWLKKEQHELLMNKGEDWPKIAHIPYIRVNGVTVQNLYL
uniref:NB-ARC domain-containing protein n=2 Tax=Oryza nivara TaxID=4536 RepID=A0A0E0I1I7_ORYNI